MKHSAYMMASSNCWQAPVSYVIFSEERPKRVACARFHFSRITCICWFVRFNSSVRTASWLRNSFSCSMLSSKSCRISFLFSFVSCSFDNASALRTLSLLRFYGSSITEEAKKHKNQTDIFSVFWRWKTPAPKAVLSVENTFQAAWKQVDPAYFSCSREDCPQFMLSG